MRKEYAYFYLDYRKFKSNMYISWSGSIITTSKSQGGRVIAPV